MIAVNSVVFQRGVFWESELGSPQIASEEFWDIDGGHCTQYTPIESAGRTISLVAEGSDTGSRGCFTRLQLEQIRALELSQEIVPFVYGSINLSIRVPSNPLNVIPLRKMYGHLPDDVYYGTITLKEV